MDELIEPKKSGLMNQYINNLSKSFQPWLLGEFTSRINSEEGAQGSEAGLNPGADGEPAKLNKDEIKEADEILESF